MARGADVVIVGRGPAGFLFASLLVQHGGRVTMVADGQGTLPLWGGHWDFRSYSTDQQPITNPYAWWRQSGKLERQKDAQLWRRRWSNLEALWTDVGIPVNVNLEPGLNRWIMTPMGHMRPTYLSPAWHFSMDYPGPVVIVEFPGLADFSAGAVSVVYQWATGHRAETIRLEPPSPWREGWHALNWAWYLDSEPGRQWLLGALTAKEWPKDAAVVFPQVLGIDQVESLLREIARIVDRPIGEVPLLPPSVGGIRVSRRWERWLKYRGLNLVTGHVVHAEGNHVLLANGRKLHGDQVVLATGGVLGGGLVVAPDGSVRNPITDTRVGSIAGSGIGWVGHVDWNRGMPVVGRTVGGWNPDREGNGGALILWTVHEAFQSLVGHMATVEEG